MAKVLTAQQIRAMQPRAKPYEVMDGACPGLGIRVNRQGSKVWIYRYRTPKTPDGGGHVLRRMRLGLWTGEQGTPGDIYLDELQPLTVAQARERCVLMKQQRAVLGDPLAERERRRRALAEQIAADGRAARDDAYKVRDLLGEYVEHVRRSGRRTVGAIERWVDVDILPVVGSIPVADFTRQDAYRVLLRQIEAGHNSAARKLATILSAAWAHAVDQGRVEYSPVERLKTPQDRRRDRVLNERELVAFLAGLPCLGDPVAGVLRLQLLTGCRPGEATALRWADLDLDGAAWVIPADRHKSGRQHVVRLPAQAVAYLDGLPRRAAPVFLTRLRSALQVGSVNARLRQRFADCFQGIEPFPPHTLRHTVKSHLQRLGCPLDVRDAILGHVDRTSAAARYEHYQFVDEKLEWLQRWADYLDGLSQSG